MVLDGARATVAESELPGCFHQFALVAAGFVEDAGVGFGRELEEVGAAAGERLVIEGDGEASGPEGVKGPEEEAKDDRPEAAEDD